MAGVLQRRLIGPIWKDRAVVTKLWIGDPNDPEGTKLLKDVFDRAGAFRLLDENSRDAALVLTLTPGAYTMRVKSMDSNPGVTLLEVYDVP